MLVVYFMLYFSDDDARYAVIKKLEDLILGSILRARWGWNMSCFNEEYEDV